MNWEHIGVFDGGWCEWSTDPGNPVICRFDAQVEKVF
jgi:3-mercaptopyruvate sulfurtransferase SseA